MDEPPSKSRKHAQIKTDITHRFFKVRSGCEIGSSSCSDPHLCQEEEKAISSRLVAFARPCEFPQTVPFTAVCLSPSSQLVVPSLNLSSRLSSSSSHSLRSELRAATGWVQVC